MNFQKMDLYAWSLAIVKQYVSFIDSGWICLFCFLAQDYYFSHLVKWRIFLKEVHTSAHLSFRTLLSYNGAAQN